MSDVEMNFDEVENDAGGGDTFQEVEYDSWFSRLKDSFGGICIGLLLLVGSQVMLFWNEGRNVSRVKDLNESENNVISLSSISTIDNQYEGKLVHVFGKTSVTSNLTDTAFGISEEAIRMQRVVETYQWVETSKKNTEKKTGGGTTTTTTYDYNKQWKEGLLNSFNFKYATGHENPTTALYDSIFQLASPVYLEAFTLPETVTSLFDSWTTLTNLPMSSQNTNTNSSSDTNTTTTTTTSPTIINNYFYFGNTFNAPIVGDTRVSFQVVETSNVSILAKQTGNRLVPYITSRGGEILLVEKGYLTADEMIEQARSENTYLTWILRLIGYILCLVGFVACFQPCITFADVLPCLGDMLECGICCLGAVVAAVISGTVIALAWLFYRPVLAVGIIAVLVLLCGGFWYIGNKRKENKKSLQDDDEKQVEGYPPSPKEDNADQPFSMALGG